MNELHAVFQHELLDDEKILWAAQPNKAFHLNQYDNFLIPILFIPSIAFILVGIGVLYQGAIVGLCFFFTGFYLLIGRFYLKYMRKRNVYYAITNFRVLILIKGRPYLCKNVQIEDLYYLDKQIRKCGNGTIWFKPYDSYYRLQKNTGFEWPVNSWILFEPRFWTPVAFFDIDDAEKVYRLIVYLINQQQAKESSLRDA